MATVKFRLSAKVDKTSGRSEILVRFFHGELDQRAKTNIFVLPEYWNESGQRLTVPRARVMTTQVQTLITELTNQNTQLEQLKQFINDSFISSGAGKVKVSDTWLADLVSSYSLPDLGSVSVRFFDVFQHFINVAEFSDSRKRHFQVCWRALKRYCIFAGIDGDSFENYNGDTVRGWAKYLKDEHKYYTIETKDTENGQEKTVVFLNPRFERAYKAVPESRLPEPRGQNAINKFLNQTRCFFLWAIRNEYTQNKPFKNYEIPSSVYGTPYYITIEERNKLYNFDFSKFPDLAVQRDIFVFQCVIGCRVSDLRSFKKSNLVDGAIEYIPRKTKEGRPITVRVPLNSVAREIVERYKDTTGGRLLPCISDQKYNDNIKRMFKLAGLDRVVTILNPTTRDEEQHPLFEIASSHLARRTFIGNLYKKVKDPNLIAKLSGHTEGSKAFARYRDIDEEMRQDLVKMIE